MTVFLCLAALVLFVLWRSAAARAQEAEAAIADYQEAAARAIESGHRMAGYAEGLAERLRAASVTAEGTAARCRQLADALAEANDLNARLSDRCAHAARWMETRDDGDFAAMVVSFAGEPVPAPRLREVERPAWGEVHGDIPELPAVAYEGGDVVEDLNACQRCGYRWEGEAASFCADCQDEALRVSEA